MHASSWLWWLILPFIAWMLFIQIRYMARQYSSVGWPVIDAKIEKGPTGFVPIGGGNGRPACFMGYIFCVSGSTYTGLFALYGNTKDVERVHNNFSSGSIRIRYKLTDPSISYLNELNDARFEGLVPTQNPQHLSQAPPLGQQDAIGNWRGEQK